MPCRRTRSRSTATLWAARLGIDTAGLEGFGDALNADDVSGGAHVAVMMLLSIFDSVEGLAHDAAKLLVNLVLVPEELLQVLDPLEVGHCHPAGVTQDVGQDNDAAVVQDVI